MLRKMDARPDILWIVTTQWRAQACGYAGDPNARTPYLDALARESVNYTQAVTPHPFGPFARAALLTGVLSPENGVRDYFDPLPVLEKQRADARDHRSEGEESARSRSQPRGWTVAHGLGKLGYATGFFGKWHLGKRDPGVPLVGEAHARTIVPAEARGGFAFWEGFESGFLLNDPWLHGTRLPEPVRFEGYQSDVVSGRAARWISECRVPNAELEKPYFAVVSLEAPHPPYDAPAGGVVARDPREIVLPANVPIDTAQGGRRGGEVEAKARRELAGYYAHIEATDRAIGELIARVDAHAARRGRRTPVVVVTSVHGDMHGAHGLFRKGWPHEESVRVPLMIREQRTKHGGRIAAAGSRDRELSSDRDLTRDRDLDRTNRGGLRSGARSGSGEGLGGGRTDDAAVSLVDLPRMTLAWAEGDPSAVIDRRYSLISMPSVVALPHQCDRVWRGVRTAERKLVLNADGTPWLFFDLENDPLEMRNLVGDANRAAELSELRELVEGGGHAGGY